MQQERISKLCLPFSPLPTATKCPSNEELFSTETKESAECGHGRLPFPLCTTLWRWDTIVLICLPILLPMRVLREPKEKQLIMIFFIKSFCLMTSCSLPLSLSGLNLYNIGNIWKMNMDNCNEINNYIFSDSG